MCCCGKPTINGQMGYRWNTPDGPPGVYPVNPPTIAEGETILYDEPGRCGGMDSHSHHYRVVQSRSGMLALLVRHGGGDERIYLSGGGRVLIDPLAALDSSGRYWILNAIHHAQSHAARTARDNEAERWRRAAIAKQIHVRKQRGSLSYKVWIE